MGRLLLGAVSAAILCCLSLGTPAQEPAEALTSYVLDNGLQVVLVPDHRVPKVAMTVNYRVGGLNEPAGRSGFAHLFEHLMFSGTPAWPQSDAAYAALGVSVNAATRQDSTTYWMEGLASTLPVMLSIEADRMVNLGRDVDQEELDIQRSVVLNEMRQRFLDSPGNSTFEALNTGLFPAPHPYSRAVVGSIPDLATATLADVVAFYNTFYVPNNAILVLVGDFERSAAEAMVAETFGRLPRGAEVPVPQMIAVEPARLRLEFEDRIPETRIFLGFTGPDSRAKENAALWIAAELLGNYEYGVLRTELVNGGTAAYAFSGWRDGMLGGRFIVGAGAAGGVSAEDLEAALRKAVADFVASPISAADVERARASLFLYDRVGMEPFLSRAINIAGEAALGADLTTVVEDIRHLREVSVADVKAALQKVVVLDDASVAIVRPGARGNYPPVLNESSGTATPFPLVERLPIEVPQLTAGVPGNVGLPVVETATLSNGIALVHYQMPGAPMVYIAASATGGQTSDPAGKEGLISMAAGMSSRGAGALDLNAFSKAAKDLGADVSGHSAEQRTSVILAVPPENFEPALGLLADAVQRPRFGQSDWDVLARENIDGVKQREGNLDSVAQLTLEQQLFKPAPGEPAVHVSLASIGAISLADAKAAYERIFVPAAITFYSVGALPLTEMIPALEAQFGGWQSMGKGVPSKPYAKIRFAPGRHVFFVPEVGASQSMIYVARPAPGFDDPSQVEAVAVGRLLGGDFLSRLNTIIREEKGYSYGVNSYIYQSLRTGSALVINAPVAVEATGAVLAEVLAGFDGLREIPVTEDELNRSAAAYLTSIASTAETAGSLFGTLLGGLGAGLSLNEIQENQLSMTRLQLADVQSEATTLASLQDSVIVIAGDPKAILPQFAAAGIEDFATIERE